MIASCISHFAGRPLNSIDLSNYPQERPALTSALYAMRKSDFYQYGMFDEFYYNKLESFELSLRLSLNGNLVSHFLLLQFLRLCHLKHLILCFLQKKYLLL